MKPVKLMIAAALLASPLSVATASTVDTARQNECAVNYMALTLMGAILSSDDSPATPEQKKSFQQIMELFAGKTLKLTAATSIETVPEDVKKAALAKLEAATKMQDGSGLTKIVDDAQACDKELGM